jgi:hypothetical protein
MSVEQEFSADVTCFASIEFERSHSWSRVSLCRFYGAAGNSAPP